MKHSLPSTWTVIVLADRGLYARWLYQQVVKLGWHPFFRINSGGTFRPVDRSVYHPLAQVVPNVGACWCGAVICFKTHPLPCTLLARWDDGHTEAWLIVTSLPPPAADACWYGMRAWIEAGFKDTKRGGWHWQQTRITDPQRAERIWLAMAVATLWVVSVGGFADATASTSGLEALPLTHIARRRPSKRSRPRLLSCFRRGCLIILAALLTGRSLPLGQFYPEPWPASSGSLNSKTYT